jgi:hypothetical protein
MKLEERMTMKQKTKGVGNRFCQSTVPHLLQCSSLSRYGSLLIRNGWEGIEEGLCR